MPAQFCSGTVSARIAGIHLVRAHPLEVKLPVFSLILLQEQTISLLSRYKAKISFIIG